MPSIPPSRTLVLLLPLLLPLADAGRSPGLPVPSPPAALCWAEGADRTAVPPALRTLAASTAVFEFPDGNRWEATSSDGVNLERGQPTTLTWGFLPDGVEVGLPDTTLGPSDLIATLDGYFGEGPGGTDLTLRPWFRYFAEALDAWSAVTGVRHVYMAQDDGGSFPDSRGTLTVRPDVRIAGAALDGPRGVLAFNYFPDVGDMVFDTSENLAFFAAEDYRDLKNIIAHEHGHGLGLRHSCPEDGTKLMEPTANFTFLGPQHDDVLGANRGYGDTLEQPAENDTFLTATDLGSFGPGDSIFVAGLSIDGDSDRDVFAVTLPPRMRLTVTADPVGFTYFHGPQQFNDGVPFCSITETLRTRILRNLGIEILAPSGTEPLLTANYQPLGSAEEITEFLLEEAGTYYIRVFGEADEDQPQLYDLTVSVGGGTPPQAICRDVTSCNGNIGAPRINNGSFDPDGDPLTLTLDPPPPYPPGTTLVRLVADDRVYADTCEALVTVNLPPLAACRDLDVPADSAAAPVEVPAASLDDGTTDPEGSTVTLSLDPAGPFPLGLNEVRFIATDACGASDTCRALLAVGDDIPVEILSLAAERQEDRVEVRWEVSERTAERAGFDVYREAAGSPREKLNTDLLEGSAAYTFVDPSPPSSAIEYWLQEVNRSGTTRWYGPLSVEALTVPGMPLLGPPFPNPFTGATRMTYTLTEEGPVRIAVYDHRGRLVRVLVEANTASGTHETSWDGRTEAGSPVSAGIYFLRLDAGGAVGLRKVVRVH